MICFWSKFLRPTWLKFHGKLRSTLWNPCGKRHHGSRFTETKCNFLSLNFNPSCGESKRSFYLLKKQNHLFFFFYWRNAFFLLFVNLVFFKMNSYSKIFFSWQKFPSFLSSVMKFKKSSIVLNKNWLKQSPLVT